MSAAGIRSGQPSRIESARNTPGVTVRFSKVVESCGRPEIVYLWTEPEHDPKFMRAVRENRVLTLNQETVGTQKDFGVIGFFEGDNAAYLVFEKPLTRFQLQRVIGINYDLIKPSAPVGAPIKPARESKPGLKPRHRLDGVRKEDVRGHRDAREMEKPPKRFRVKFRFNASSEVALEVEAESRKEAIEKASSRVVTPEFSRATISRKVLKVENT